MKSYIEKYLKQKTEELAFITIKSSAELSGIDIKINDEGLKVPIKNSVLVKGIQDNSVQRGISMMSIADGMLYIMGIDSDFTYNDKYREFLFEFERSFNFSHKDYCGYVARKNFEAGEVSDALVYMKAAVMLSPDDEEILYHYAIVLQEMAERYKKDENIRAVNDFMLEALRSLEKIIKINPKNSMAYYQLAFHYLNQNQFQKAQLSWKKALDIGVDAETDAEIRNNMEENYHRVRYEEGYNLVLAGRADQGLEILHELETRFPDWWNLLFMIGLGYRSMGDMSKAINYFEKILMLRPSQVDTLVEYGLCLAQMGDLEGAIDKFSKAAKIKEDPEILCNLGMAYLENGDLDNASYYIERASEIDPNDEVTNSCMAVIDNYKNNHMEN